MKIKANKILAVLCVIAMLMTMIVPMTLTATAAEETYSHTFTSKDFSANNQTKALSGKNWTVTSTSSYVGWDNNNGKGFQFGSSNNPAKELILTSESFSNVSKIVITTSGASKVAASFVVKVGDVQVGQSTTLTATSTSYTFTPNAPMSGAVEFVYTQTSSKAIYIKSIEITYGAVAEGCVHEAEKLTLNTEESLPATCTEGGTEVYNCECGETITKTLNALGHTWDDGEIITEADCENDGEIVYTCNNCEDTMSKVIPATGHNWDGTTCAECGETISEGTEIVFNFGANKDTTHVDGSTDKATYSETSGPYTLNLTGMSKAYPESYDNVGNSALKFGTNSAAGKFSLTVPDSIAKVIINVAGYKATAAKITVNDTAYTINTLSNNGEYTAIEVDTSTTKTVTFTTVSGGYRCMVDSIIFVVGGECAHLNKSDVVNTATCTEGGIYSYICDDCGYEHSEEIPATGHNFVEEVCTACGTSEYPEMTINEVIASGDGTKVMLKDVVIVSIDDAYSEDYGNITVTVQDAEGSTLKLYRLKGNFELGATITAKGEYVLYNGNTPELSAGCTAVVTKDSVLPQLNALEATMSLAYTYTEVDGVLSNSKFVLKCGVDAALTNIEGVTYGIAVSAGGKTVYYKTTANSWTVDNENNVVYVYIDLGNMIDDETKKFDTTKFETEFTVRAFVEVNDVKFESTSTKAHSVKTMVAEYNDLGYDVEHLYGILFPDAAN